MANIILVGMPGSGKSTLGKKLAKVLNKNFVDTDKLIEELEGAKLQEIINAKGNDYLLELEHKVCLDFDGDDYVIATGGSAVYHKDSIEHMRGEDGTVLYIKIRPETMVNRIHNLETRGIVLKEGQTLQDLYSYRAPIYEEVCDVKVKTDGLPVKTAVLKLETILRNTGKIS